jgi:hypothetical protein
MDTALNPNNYPTYNVGDKVTIRQWDDMESEFGLIESGEIKVPKFFTEPMKQYCGQTLPIVYVRHHVPPNFDSYYLGGSSAVFSSLMFEQSYPTVVCASTLSFDDLLKGATAQLANPQA